MMARPPKAVRDTMLNDTRQSLLGAAAAEFASEGYIGANINRISTAAGFAKGTIYNYFPSKKSLLMTLIDETASCHIDMIRAHVERAESPPEQLEAFFEGGFAFVVAHPAPARVVINAVYGPDPEFTARVHQAYAPLYDLLSNGILGAGVARGDFRPVELEPTAGLIMTVYLGSCALVDADNKIGLSIAQIMPFVLDGLRPRE